MSHVGWVAMLCTEAHRVGGVLAGQAIQEGAEESMRRLIASEFMTLDGVMEAPGHDQHQDGKNAWALRYAGGDQQRYKAEGSWRPAPSSWGA